MRRSAKHIFFGACLAAGILSGGCKKGWIDINYNPLQLTETNATPDLILPNLLLEAQAGKQQFELQAWMGYWTYTDYPAGIPMLTYYPLDETLFSGSTPDVNILLFEENAKRTNQPFYVAIAKVLKAISWSRAVDNCNNLPYFEANKADIRKPHYDNGQVIYEDLMKQLDEAITLMKGTSPDKALRIGIADIMFHGDRTMWYKFINTFKLRLLMHQASRADRAQYIQAEIAKITAEGSGFLQSGEDADMNPGFTSQKPSQVFSQWSKWDIYVRWSVGFAGGSYSPLWQLATANVYAMDLLKANNDPRLGFFYNLPQLPTPAGDPEPFTQRQPLTYKGARLGQQVDRLVYPHYRTEYMSTIGGVAAYNSPVSPLSTGIIKGYDMPVWIMTSTESLFLQAEAIYRGWLPGDAETAYKNAVRESFRWLNVGGNTTVPSLSDDKFNTWYTQETTAGNQQVSWAAAPDKYKLLMFQKYMAFNGIEPFETWIDYRRNGFPDIPLSYDVARHETKLPIRSPYPAKEALLNRENLEAQGVIDYFNSKIWWMP